MAASPLLAMAEQAFRAGDMAGAEEALIGVLDESPGHSRANELLGYIAGNRGDLERAHDFLRRATSTPGASAEAWYYLGSVLLQKARHEDAATALTRSLAMAGDFFEGLHDLAVATTRSGKPSEALPLFDKAETLRSASFELLNNKGIALNLCRRSADAIETYERASALQPAHPMPWLNKGVALHDLGRYQDAVSCYRRALALKPDYVEAWCNMGGSTYQLNLLDEATAHYRQALARSPEDADSEYGLSVTLLAQGRLQEGLGLHEARWRKTDADAERHREIPRWLGESPLDGKRVLLWAEQGYGDTIQFCRYAPLVAALGADVTLEVQPPLKALIATLRAGRVIGRGERSGDYDFQAPLLSLPLALRTTLETVPHATPYLSVDPVKAARWKERLAGRNGKRTVAIACSGRRSHKNDRNRSMALAHFAPLQEIADLFVVQKELSAQDRELLGSSPGIRFLGHDIEDFQDTAAIAAGVDLVVSVDTSLAHVAGALGKPVWILLPWAPDWRWLLGRADSPWYPTARLFRQAKADDWEGVMAEVRRALQRAAGVEQHRAQ